jgi:poly-gamma-glutamate capsule biosynthesis protein CapA/YwtB (metallophosphatase superfamily)
MDDMRHRLRGAGGASSGSSAARPVSRPQQSSPNQPRPTPTARPPIGPRPLPAAQVQTMQKRARAKKRRWPYVLLTLLLIVGLGGAGVFAYKKYQDSQPRHSESSPPKPRNPAANEQPGAEVGPIRLIATGDMIAHDSINENARKDDGTYDYFSMMSEMKPFFDKADVRFCNQATPAGGERFGVSGYPVFNAPQEFTLDMIKVGCNVVNIGTNHTNDKGQDVINATISGWDNQPGVLAVAGANRTREEQAKIRYFTVKGLKFAFLAYSTYSNDTNLTPHGLNMYSDEVAQAQIAEAKENNAKFIIVSMRWGTEYSPDINESQDRIAQMLADAGADLVLGHGPHVLEPVKRVKARESDHEAVVWFSLGNFLNSQIPIETLVGGLAVIEIDGVNRKIESIGFMPVYMHYEWSAADRAGNNLMARRGMRMTPLDKAGELLASSTHSTSVEAETERVKTVLNQFTPVTMLTSETY